jgi:hypothetical protein
MDPPDPQLLRPFYSAPSIIFVPSFYPITRFFFSLRISEQESPFECPNDRARANAKCTRLDLRRTCLRTLFGQMYSLALEATSKSTSSLESKNSHELTAVATDLRLTKMVSYHLWPNALF